MVTTKQKTTSNVLAPTSRYWLNTLHFDSLSSLASSLRTKRPIRLITAMTSKCAVTSASVVDVVTVDIIVPTQRIIYVSV